MAVLPFQGSGDPLSNNGFTAVAASLNVNPPEIWTVLAVETSGCGYLPDSRPQILFERHIFHKLTAGRFDDGSISDPTPGGYGPRGAPQYERLAAAIAKDRSAALQSASWGLGQIMGMNFKSAGFDNVEQMVQAMVDSEDQQLRAIAKFLTATGLSAPLKVHNWASFARGYNGPNFAINRYDVKLNAEFQKYTAAGVPDLDVRAAQLYLTYAGFHPGSIDGVAGEHTLDALAQFQSQQGISATTVIDAQCLAQLRDAASRSLAATA